MKLNLGCGNDIKAGFVNLDINPGHGVDVVHNLDKFPYPFKDDTFDEIRAYSILEHVADLMKTMSELHRILKPGGRLDIIVPHYNGPLAWGNPTHIRTFTYESFKFFVRGFSPEKYTDDLFSRSKITLRFGKGAQIWNHLIEPLANAFPSVYENTPFSMFPSHGLRAILTK